MPFSSPPASDLKEAPIWEPMLRERTVRPKTSPRTSSISYPGRSFIVEMIMGASLTRRPEAGARNRSEVEDEDPAPPVAVLAVAVGHPPVAERLVEPVGVGLVGAAPERDPLGAEGAGQAGGAFGQRPADPRRRAPASTASRASSASPGSATERPGAPGGKTATTPTTSPASSSTTRRSASAATAKYSCSE